MVSSGQVLGFALTCVIVIAVPGPSVLFVIGRALAHGRRTALASVAGNVAGVQVVAVSVALGIGTLVQRSDQVFTIVKLGGAAYLVWLGVQAIRHRRALSAAMEVAAAPRSAWKAAAEGFTVGVANPKAYVLFAAVLPQFANRAAGHHAHPERHQRDRDDLEIGQAQRDADDGQAEQDAGEQVGEREFPAKEDDPEDVANEGAQARRRPAVDAAPERP